VFAASIPASLAYSVTIHKSQGATLEEAVVGYLTNMFLIRPYLRSCLRSCLESGKLTGPVFGVPFSLDQLQVKRDITGIFRAKDYSRRIDAGEILVPYNTS
jgi:hypothetical protein